MKSLLASRAETTLHTNNTTIVKQFTNLLSPSEANTAKRRMQQTEIAKTLTLLGLTQNNLEDITHWLEQLREKLGKDYEGALDIALSTITALEDGIPQQVPSLEKRLEDLHELSSGNELHKLQLYLINNELYTTKVVQFLDIIKKSKGKIIFTDELITTYKLIEYGVKNFQVWQTLQTILYTKIVKKLTFQDLVFSTYDQSGFKHVDGRDLMFSHGQPRMDLKSLKDQLWFFERYTKMSISNQSQLLGFQLRYFKNGMPSNNEKQQFKKSIEDIYSIYLPFAQKILSTIETDTNPYDNIIYHYFGVDIYSKFKTAH